jgi:hypothetical protein
MKREMQEVASVTKCEVVHTYPQKSVRSIAERLGPGRAMSNLDDAQRCDLCKTGNIIKRKEQIEFRQWTDKGYVFCRTVIPIGVCDHCGSRNWDHAAEPIIEEAVRKQYEKMP